LTWPHPDVPHQEKGAEELKNGWALRRLGERQMKIG